MELARLKAMLKAEQESNELMLLRAELEAERQRGGVAPAAAGGDLDRVRKLISFWAPHPVE